MTLGRIHQIGRDLPVEPSPIVLAFVMGLGDHSKSCPGQRAPSAEQHGAGRATRSKCRCTAAVSLLDSIAVDAALGPDREVARGSAQCCVRPIGLGATTAATVLGARAGAVRAAAHRELGALTE